jgi:hypothetical protein
MEGLAGTPCPASLPRHLPWPRARPAPRARLMCRQGPGRPLLLGYIRYFVFCSICLSRQGGDEEREAAQAGPQPAAPKGEEHGQPGVTNTNKQIPNPSLLSQPEAPVQDVGGGPDGQHEAVQPDAEGGGGRIAVFVTDCTFHSGTWPGWRYPHPSGRTPVDCVVTLIQFETIPKSRSI